MPLTALSSTAVAQEDGPAFKSPLLFDLLGKQSPEERFEILDTGRASAGSIDYLSGYRCRLYVADCVTALRSLEPEVLEEPDEVRRVLSGAFPLNASGGTRLDIVLLWDLPNYLALPVLGAVLQHLLPYTHRGTILHSYVYTSQTMPAAPAHYHLQRDGRIERDFPSAESADCPRYYQEVLHRHLHPFRVKRSTLLAGGVEETLMAR